MKHNFIIILLLTFFTLTTATGDICSSLQQLRTQLYAYAESDPHHNKINQIFQLHSDALRKILTTDEASPQNLERALFLAAAYGNQEIITLLLNTGINPDIYTNRHQTPLMYAAMHGNIETIKVLLDYGAQPNKQDNQGKTASNYTNVALEHFGSNTSLEILMVSILKYGANFDPFGECKRLLE